ncbi:protein tyrosine phosphatase [Pedobacter psychrophilus]|uniref:protein-tyrosine-phosphatase n=1 Tax=Pedobacter psychrophilus TaxID=1826909 RepID=A0A179DBW9_9SPHI|nr:low molecular weight protein-tyrosine-phosphatase [Pedobacter psychrophilus]OAQ37953.1 protein tyrosine phosphatase [Pedobacter psychrophilus]
MKILMVCLGNICRSPLAEGIMKHFIDKEGLGWQVDSAGTGAYHIGRHPDVRSIKIAQQNGIDISHQKARQFIKADFKTFDHIYVMDKHNYEDVINLATSDEEKQKVKLFITDEIVPDPYYDDSLFKPTFNMIYAQCGKLLTSLKKENR